LQAAAKISQPMQALHGCFVVQPKIKQASQIVNAHAGYFFNGGRAFFWCAQQRVLIEVMLSCEGPFGAAPLLFGMNY